VRVVLMRGGRVYGSRRQRRSTAAAVRRIAVTTVAVVLVVAAEVAATVSPTAESDPRPHRPAVSSARGSPAPYDGEPRIRAGTTASAAARAAAVRFVRDYTLWSGGRVGTIPAEDATERVIRLLEQQRRYIRVSAVDAVNSIRIVAAAPDRYVITSAVGNFLVGTRGSRWLVVSLPGD